MELEEDLLNGNVKAESLNQDGQMGDGYICETCCKVFPKLEYLKEHRKKVHSEKRFACTLCDKVLKSKDAIKKHMTVHTGERNYICKHCGKAFADPSSRNQHEKYQHPSEGTEIVCKECGKQFKYPRNLKLHMVHHSQGKPYDGQRNSYSNEIKVEALKWVSEIGATKTALKLNIPVSAIRNWVAACKSDYQCSRCEKTFHSKQRLTEHERTIHNEQSLSRGKGYKFSDEFKKEVSDFAANTSTREACEFYGLGESTVRGFIKLLYNPLYCTHCSRKCKNQSQLEKHLDEVHKIGSDRPFYPKQESLTQYLENVNIDKNILSESFTDRESRTREEVDPQNIVPYDPSDNRRQPKEIKPKEKRKRLKKEVKSKLSKMGKNNVSPIKIQYSNLSKVICYEILHEILDDMFYVGRFTKEEEVKIEVDMDVKEELEDDYDYGYDIINGEYLNDNEQQSDEEHSDIQGELENLGSGDFDAFLSILNGWKSAEETSQSIPDVAEQVKSERSSVDEKNVNNNSMNVEDFDFDRESHEITVEDAKVENSDHEVKRESCDEKQIVGAETKEIKITKKNKGPKPHSKKVRTFPKKAEHLIDFSIDLARYDINEQDDEFCILSKHFKDEKFMDVVLSKKYKHKKKHYRCSECSKMFRTACDTVRHLKMHSSEKSYLCEFCHTSFSFKANLLRHIQKQHTETGLQERFKCQYCGNEYKDKSSLKTHEQKHNDSVHHARHQCSICGVDYSSKQTLVQHMAVVHEGQNPIKHICNVCGKQFRKTQNYRAHYNAHLYGKQHSCDLCGKTFQQANYLKTHKMFSCKNAETISRVNMKKFKCQFCEKEYADNRGMMDHVKIVHEGKRDNFVCDICSKVFSRRTSLSAHKLLHTGEFKIFTCDNCGTSFKDKRYLARHQEKCHKSE